MGTSMLIKSKCTYTQSANHHSSTERKVNKYLMMENIFVTDPHTLCSIHAKQIIFPHLLFLIMRAPPTIIQTRRMTGTKIPTANLDELSPSEIE